MAHGQYGDPWEYCGPHSASSVFLILVALCVISIISSILSYMYITQYYISLLISSYKYKSSSIQSWTSDACWHGIINRTIFQFPASMVLLIELTGRWRYMSGSYRDITPIFY